MKAAINMQTVKPLDEQSCKDNADWKQLFDMRKRAESYLSSHKWCPPIERVFLGYAVPDVIALFLFKMQNKIGGTDDWLWVVEGDVPSAYFVPDRAPDPPSALSVYCEMMESWAHAVLNGATLDNVYPVVAPSTPQFANMLLSRTRFIQERLIPDSRSKMEGKFAP